MNMQQRKYTSVVLIASLIALCLFQWLNTKSKNLNLDSRSKFSFQEFSYDQSRQFKSVSFLATGSKWNIVSDISKVCLATQTSLDRLDELIPLTENWPGPISVAIFAPGQDFYLAKHYIGYLKQCHQSNIQMVKPSK